MINEHDISSDNEFDQAPVAQPVPPPPSVDNSDSDYAARDFGETDEENQVTANKMFDKKAAQSLIFENGGYPFLVLICSIVAIVAASSNCGKAGVSCTGYNAWAVAASVISCVVSLFYLVFDKKGSLTPQIQLGGTIFLFLWWCCFTGVATFKGPFTVPSNGYFACWGGLLASSIMLVNSVGKAREAVDKFQALGYKIALAIVGSIVVFIAGIAHAGSGLGNYAISAGVISTVFFIGRVFAGDKLSANAEKIFALFMVVWWGVAMFILTFIGPFDQVGNGYFAVWICLICSLLFLEN